MTADESPHENEASLADEPEVRQAIADGDRASVAGVVTGHPSSPLAWTELADIADSEGRPLEAFAFATVAADLAREQLAESGWQQGDPVPWSDEPNRAYLRALDTQRRSAEQLKFETRATRYADELAAADPEAPARIASEFTPTQLMAVIPPADLVSPATTSEAQSDPIEPPAAADSAGED